jgi:hypothetical protein
MERTFLRVLLYLIAVGSFLTTVAILYEASHHPPTYESGVYRPFLVFLISVVGLACSTGYAGRKAHQEAGAASGR